MNVRNVPVVCSLALLVLVSACSGGGSSSSSDGASDSSAGAGTSPPASGPSSGSNSTDPDTRASALVGTWRDSDCKTDDASDLHSYTRQLSFDGSSEAVLTVFAHRDTGLCQGDFYFAAQSTLSYTVGDDVVTSDNGTVRPLDMTITSSRLIASDSYLDKLADDGTTLEEFWAGFGISDIDNVPDLFVQPDVFTAFQVADDSLLLGLDENLMVFIGDDPVSGGSENTRIVDPDTTWSRINEDGEPIYAGTSDNSELANSTLPMDPVLEIPTSGNDECTHVLRGDITSPTTLTNTDAVCDYLFDDFTDVRARLTIEPGVAVRATVSAALVVHSGGSIIADGTPRNPIVFDGASHAPGFWQGITFEGGEESVFNHFHLVDAGQNCTAPLCPDVGLILQDVRASFTNSSVSNSNVIGLDIAGDAHLVDFSNNRLFNNGAAGLVIASNRVPALDTRSDYTGGDFPNGIRMIRLEDDLDGFDGVFVWKDLGVPYLIEGVFDLINGTVVIEPGVEVVVGSEATIDVNAGASLQAIGTANNRISIRGLQQQPGYWNGIRFVSSDYDSNIFQYVDVTDHGNQNPISATNAAFELQTGSRLTLDNMTISNGAGWGVLCDEGNPLFPLSVPFSHIRINDNVFITNIAGNQIDSDCQPF